MNPWGGIHGIFQQDNVTVNIAIIVHEQDFHTLP